MVGSKIAILDVDGTLLNWHIEFDRWMVSRGCNMVDDTVYNLSDRYDGSVSPYIMMELVREFNSSDIIGKLPMNQYTRAFVNDLKDQGYQIKWASSYYHGDYKTAHERRTRNLVNIFGEELKNGYSLPIGHTKSGILRFYTGLPHVNEVLFVDDAPNYIREAMEIAEYSEKMRVGIWDQPYNVDSDAHMRIGIHTFIENE